MLVVGRLSLFTLGVVLVPAVALGTPRTMRIDYYHTGNAREERFSLDRVVVEPFSWAGNPARPLDDTNLGKYFFEIIDRQTNRVLFSRGFASIYGEWELTAEAEQQNRTFSESVRFPEPARPVQLVLKKRGGERAFVEIWSLTIDPKDMLVDRSVPPAPAPLLKLQERGDPAHKVDLLILGDGYTAAEQGKFEQRARSLTERLFATQPFKDRRADFNVWGLCPAAAASGISRPSTGIWRRSPLGATYDAFRSERYVLTFENRAWREVAQFAPYDTVVILVNDGTYGGGGIFNLYATIAAESRWAPYMMIHELGHSFGDLGDEYYTSDVAYQSTSARPEPWEPNVTAETDPARLKWRDLLTKGVPLPTPWRKLEFEEESRAMQKIRKQLRADRRPEAELDALFEKTRQAETRLLGTDVHSGKVGLFEGANYQATGYYRSQEDCTMFSRDEVGFCAVCRRALVRMIELNTQE